MKRRSAKSIGFVLLASAALGMPAVLAADFDAEMQAGEMDAGEGDTQLRTASQRTMEGQLAELNSRYIDLVIVKQSVTGVMQAIGEQAKIQVTLAKGLSGELTSLRLNGPLRMCLDQVANRIGAVWWWNGKELRMASRRDSTTRTVKTEYADHMMAVARQLGIPVGALTVAKAPDVKMVRISGPPALVTDLEALAKDVATQLGSVKMMKYGKAMNGVVK